MPEQVTGGVDSGRCSGDGETCTDGTDWGAKSAVLVACVDAVGQGQGSPPSPAGVLYTGGEHCKRSSNVPCGLSHHIAFIMCPGVHGQSPL